MMVQPASISSTLPALRPPTPPRESDHKAGIFNRLFMTKDVPSQTPDITPASSSESPSQTEQSKKRVAFDDTRRFVPVSVSDGERKPIKSILKPYNGSSIQISIGPSKLSPPHTYANLGAMLESVAQQLAGKDRSSKMDAYTTLSGVLKASENIPDIRALKDKMSLLLQFIRRDLSVKSTTGSLDTSLVVNALILLSIFLHRPAIAESLTTEFSIYIVDHAIKTFEDDSTPKDVVKHLMLILAEQNFSPKIMNGDRAGRLISSLQDIEDHVKGKSIVVGRINIYRRLLRQSKAHMSVNTAWIKHLFGDMFSTVKDTRASAVCFGLEAGLVLGTEMKASRAFTDLFASDLVVADVAVKFGEYYAGRLKSMVEMKQDMSSVPQIWSVPILFLRSKPRQLEQWVFRNPWLEVIQKCFNSSDQQTKLEANLAWNRLVFVVQPDEKTTPSMITMLYQPLREQLRRKNKGRKAALGSLCNLLYYSLKPTSTPAQLDLYWDRYLVDAVGKALAPRNTLTSTPESSRQDSIDACRILTTLFDSATPRSWSETRAMDSGFGKDIAMEISELPSLDSKWLRKSAARVFPIMSPLLEKLYWDLGGETEAVTALWQAYITSIASPAVMEVKVSNDTMSCVACIFGLMYKIWQRGPKALLSVPHPEEPLSDGFLLSFEKILSTTITGLGLLPFTEKLLSIGGEDEFVVVATPSQQPRKARGEPKCPLHHLFVLFTHASSDITYDRKFSEMVHRLLSPFLDARPSKRGKLDLIRDLLELIPQDGNEPCRIIWSILADFATFATDTREGGKNGGPSDLPLGMEYRGTLKVLEFGVDLSPAVPLAGWKTLFEALANSVTIDAGDGGRALAVIEPLGRFFQGKLSKTDGQSIHLGSNYFRTLLSKATYPKDRQALDAARRRVWGTAVSKTSTFDPYNFLYEYMRESLQKAYKSFPTSSILDHSDIITATTTLLTHCPSSLLANALAKLQNGIATWIKDENSRIVGGNPLSQSITSLWAKICQITPNVARSSNYTKLLADLEVLICSGLESRHRAIVNASIRLWNSSFGVSKEKLVYPVRVKDALLRLRPVTEIQLPFFPESLESDGVIDQRQLPHFPDTQDISNVFGSTVQDSILRIQPASPFGISPSSSSRLRNFTPQVLIEVCQSIPLKRSRESTPDSSSRKSRKRNIAPKLRHDDSQIQFEAIVSSPIANAVLDSQLLTDRQKEVKERQEAEAAIFPDIRSSPRRREKFRTSSSSELPLHRSASKSRASASPMVQRQTTPTLVPQAEFDDYVYSSPTPTRSLHENGNLLDVPSSPPEVIQEQPPAYIPDETDIPSSPPEMPQEDEIDTTTSLDPSAQIDPYADQNIPALSTFESTDNQENGSVILETAVGADVPQLAVVDDTFVAEAEIDQPIPAPEPVEIEEPAVSAPGTPIWGRESSPSAFQTPRSEIFHDSQTSPALSDNITVNEDVFVDAFSSPRLNLDKGSNQPTSSPLSYLDESSALRLMEGYDQGSGRPRRSVKFSTDNENRNQPISPASSKVLPQKDSADGPSKPLATGSEPLLGSQAPEEIVNNERTLPIEEAENSSSLPSLVPETPAARSAMNLQIVDGEEIDLDETIIVDDSILEERDAPAPARRARKRNSDTTPDPSESAAKKSKNEEVAAVSSEAPKIQEIKLEIFSPKKKASPKKRKARGRPKGSRLSSQTQTGSQPSPSQSFASVGHEGSVQDLQEMETTATGVLHSSISDEVIVMGAKGVTTVESFEAAQPEEGVPARIHEELEVVGSQGEEARLEEEMEKTSSPSISNDQNASDIEMVADTILGESSALQKSSSAVDKPEGEIHEEVAMSTSKIIKISLEPVDQVLPAQADISVQTEVVAAAPSVQGLKDKLQSIIGDLGTVALSRDEMNDLEDMFMDAKQQLYGAGRRGRAGS